MAKRTVEATDNLRGDKSLGLYLAGLTILFVVVFSYIFNEKIDLNGDNCTYYICATSLAQGDGYSDISDINKPPTNTYPPGYPILMAPLRFLTDSIIAQKVMNGLFLLFSGFLLFAFLLRLKFSRGVAVVAVASFFLNSYLLSFSTMMMAEMSSLLMTALALFFLTKLAADRPFWKDKYFYFVLLAAVYSYHIRTQNVAFIVAVALFFLFIRRWKELLAFVVGFVVLIQPWSIRNKLVGLDGNRYVDMLTMANPWRPDEGRLTITQYIGRCLETMQMLLTKALPNTFFPYMEVNYGAPTTVVEWVVGALLFVVMIYGCVKLGRYGYVIGFFTLATFGVISLFSTPSENRYLTALIPLMSIALVVGLVGVGELALQRMNKRAAYLPYLLLLFLFFTSMPKLRQLSAQNKAPFPPAYRNFFTIAKTVKEKLPPNTVVCSRKGNLFYMFSSGPVSGYSWTADDRVVIQSLIDGKSDYVVLEQLGYSSTALYLYPAIQKHPELFQPVIHLTDPDTYLLKFDREGAVNKLALNNDKQ